MTSASFARNALLLLCLFYLSACSQDAPLTSTDTKAANILRLPAEAPEARLPDGIAPTHYRLQLTIDPRQEYFSGSTEIDIDLDGETSLIWLHGKSLEVSSAFAELPSGERIPLQWKQETDNGVASLRSASALPAGTVTLTLDYRAPFDTSLDGLYKVVQGELSYAYTQFESTSARMAFPSFDEPAFKVPFDISLRVPQDLVSITNTPVLSETTEDGYKNITYATSKPLPTYLVAFAVGPFDVVDWQAIPANAYRDEPIPLRGITTRGKGPEIRYALENTEAIVLDMEHYFDTRYPYAKLDLIAVPDFRAGAMENAGAITYREQLLLLDESSSVRQKRNFRITHAHELAHQWFGNLVTPVWWDDIWLNESFATWNASIILDRLYPDDNYRESLASSSHWVMRRDSLASARQIREPIVRHADIGSAFNGITYLKGGGVLTMFEAFLGPDNFRDGIRQYMKDFAFGNTTAFDFIDAIAAANPHVARDDLTAAFKSFIELPGMPAVDLRFDCDQSTPRLKASQRRYLPAGSQGDSSQSWGIPFCADLRVGDKTNQVCSLLTETTQEISLTGELCPQTLMPNSDGTGYYRWSMTAEQWQALLSQFSDLTAAEQISIADSLSAALNDGSLNLTAYLESLPTLLSADSYRVAMASSSDINKIKHFVLQEHQRPAFEQRLQLLYRPRLAELESLPALTADQREFRARLMSALALTAQDAATRQTLAEQAFAFTGFGGNNALNPKAIDANIRLLALRVAVEEAGQGFTDLLWQHFLTSDDALMREHLLRALAWSEDPRVAAIMRDRILSPELRDNEIYNIFWYQMAREANRDAIWAWTQEKLDEVLARIPAQNRGGLVAVFDDFCDKERALSVETTFSPIISSLESGPRNLANTLETINLCAAFVELHQSSAKEL